MAEGSSFKIGWRKFYLGYALTNRSKCSRCKKTIAIGSLCVREELHDGKWRTYTHPECAVNDMTENLKKKKVKWASHILANTLNAIQLIKTWQGKRSK